MTKMFKSLGVVLLLVASFAVRAQNREITGTVTGNDTKQPLAGITVTVKGTKKATVTDLQGHFHISVDNKATTLVFTSAGYTPFESPITATSSTINVELLPEVKAIEDVVVIGYQTVKRKDVLASVASVSAKDLKDIPINSAAEALNGRLAGVTATTSEGSPDATIRIRVRGGMSITGDNSPLFIIDGVQVENGLNTISPQDIQTIDVLKDAAATAIYGARGANGVVIITTKSGKPGKAKVSYNGFVGVKTLAKTLDVMSPYDFVFYQSERSRGSSTDSTSFTNNFGHGWDTLNVYKNIPSVDWQKKTFGRTGITQTHSISVSGGNKTAVYALGYTYNDEKAIVINSHYRRHLFNFKGDYNLARHVKAGVSGRFSHQDVYGAGVSDTKGSTYNRLRNAVKYRPFLSNGFDIEDSDPIADPNVGNGLNLYNPILLANSEYRKKTTDAYNVTANVSWEIIKGLTVKSVFGFDYTNLLDLQFSDSLTPLSILQGSKKPVVGMDTTIKKTVTNSNVITYAKTWKDHNFSILAGEETYDLSAESHSGLYKGFPTFTSPKTAFNQTSLGSFFTGYPKLTKSRYTSLSFFGRMSYAYKDKYLVSGNIRADAASKFKPGEQWGYFPSGSVAWRLSKEKFFMNALPFINEFKLRAGYGMIGNNRIDDYLYISNFASDGKYYYGMNNQSVIAYYPTSLPNENLQWESTVNHNYGVDISLFRRFDLSVDLYNNISSKLLLDVPIDPTYGTPIRPGNTVPTQIQNVGKTSNKGVELQLNAIILRKKNALNWNASFNIAFNKNKILQLGTNQLYFSPAASWGVSGQPTDYIEQINYPVGSFYGLINDGFYTVADFNYNASTSIYTLKPGVVTDSSIIGTVQPGSIRFKDVNGDGKVDLTNDKTIIGDPTPKFTGGLNQQFTYKNWDASIFVNFSYGNDVYNANKIELTNGYSNNSNMLAIMAGHWRIVNDQGQTVQWTVPNPTGGLPFAAGVSPDQLAALNANATIWQPIKSSGAFTPSSWAIEDGSFLRINNVTIGYTLPVKKLAGLKMSKLRFYFTGNNLHVFTKYSGYDPEVNVRSNPLTPGLDYSAYPKSRSFIFGVNASF
jgi:TonB-linked SusC/RagA family outer membrane protein